MKYIEGWLPNTDAPLELVFEFENWLFEQNDFKTAFEQLKANNADKEDLMMLLLYNKFKKYKQFTVEDALKLNIEEEFNTMFSPSDVFLIMFNCDWKELKDKH